jgi:hypothetical protein
MIEFYAVENEVRQGRYPGRTVRACASHSAAVTEMLRLNVNPPPYQFCRAPSECAGRGYCQRNPACK